MAVQSRVLSEAPALTARDPRSPTGRGEVVLFGAVVLCSAMLLFAVEPLFTKLVLPRLGSTPAVWNTAIVFYQAVLLAGYAYAHLTTHRLPRRLQVALHLGVALLPFLLLPIAIRIDDPPNGDANPIPWLIAALALGVGLPFFVLSTTGPLLQRWFSSIGHPRSADPYFLYRASNIGSAIGLLCYPLLAEPLLTLHQQAVWWTAAYAVFVALLIAAMLVVWRSDRRAKVHTSQQPVTRAQAAPLTWRRRMRWVVLAAIPSTWLLGITLYLTTELAPSPVLWVIPLGVYLVSLNLAFGRRSILTRERCALVLPFLIIATVGTLELHASGPLWFVGPLHLVTFFVGALVCHGEIARDRPPVQHLTSFYLWIAVGGVIGGAVSGLIAPTIFPGFIEYPLAILAATALLPRHPEGAAPRLWADVAFALAVGVLVVAALVTASALSFPDVPAHTIAFGPAALLCYSAVRRRLRFGLAVAAVLIGGVLPIGLREQPLFAGRDFFGTSRVTSVTATGMHILYSGSIVHNEQMVTGPGRDDPLTYYTRQGPVGDIFRSIAARSAGWNVGVIGLGAGAMACYATPRQHWTFYEIDPLVARLAQDPSMFTYYSDCLRGNGRVILGDGRISIGAAPDHSYNVIVIDAFGSDVVPVHLLTTEAMDLYRRKLAPGGVIVFNVSNQYVDLSGVVATVARTQGMTCLTRNDSNVLPGDAAAGRFASQWMALAGPDADLSTLRSTAGWAPAAPTPGAQPWTDDFSNLISVIRWR